MMQTILFQISLQLQKPVANLFPVMAKMRVNQSLEAIAKLLVTQAILKIILMMMKMKKTQVNLIFH